MNPAAATHNLVAACDRSLAQIDAALAELRRIDERARANHAAFSAEMARIDAMQSAVWES
jgi:hypothetical protein